MLGVLARNSHCPCESLKLQEGFSPRDAKIAKKTVAMKNLLLDVSGLTRDRFKEGV
jgi:hypothetical protein